MSISARRWIRWVPDHPTEPTDTIVLTSPKSLYTDIRTILGIDEVATAAFEKTEAELLAFTADIDGPRAADELPPHQARGRDELALSWDRLEWAFCGEAEDLGKVEGGRRKRWTHWCDSLGDGKAVAADEGVMRPYEGGAGGEELVLETGRMRNPATGVDQDYEELWAELPVSDAGQGRGRGKVCVVLVARSGEGGKPNGMVVRLGGYCQGVLRVGGRFVCERWVWHARAGTWKRMVRVGEGEVPCLLACDEGPALRVGQEVGATAGLKWRVEEVTAL